MPVRTCGICALALREGTEPRAIRLEPSYSGGKLPGVYSACNDCVEKYAPKRLAFLIASGDLPKGTPSLPGNYHL